MLVIAAWYVRLLAERMSFQSPSGSSKPLCMFLKSEQTESYQSWLTEEMT